MIIYIDSIFIENVIATYILLFETQVFTNEKIGTIEKLVASIISSIYICVMVIFKFDFLNYVVTKVILSFVIVYITYKPRQLIKYVKILLLFICVSAVNVGSITVIQNMLNIKLENAKILVYLAGFLTSYVFVKNLWKTYRTNIRNTALLLPVELYLNNRTIKYTGFIDTGNTAYSYELNTPVIFAEYTGGINKKDLEKLPRGNILVKTISNETRQNVYLFKNAKIGTKYMDVSVAFVNEKITSKGEYTMILNYLLFEKAGGIAI